MVDIRADKNDQDPEVQLRRGYNESEHSVSMKWGTTTFEYEDDGIVIRIPHVPVWICPLDGEASFTPEVTDELIATVRELIASAKRARQRQPQLREYLVQFA